MSAHIDHLLHDYVDGCLSREDREAVDRHLSECAACRAELDEIRLLETQIGTLSREIEPERDLWPGIQNRLDSPQVTPLDVHPSHRPAESRLILPSTDRPAARRRVFRWGVAAAAVAAVIFVAVSYLGSTPSWEVVALEGRPEIAERQVSGETRVRPGDWLVTDEGSRARVEVGSIGHVDVGPGTRIQVQNTDVTEHRLALSRGSIEARIFAPPRLFFVETPSATAIDLGCVYTLDVDSTGMSTLHVKAGYVELVKDGRTSVVPAGKMAFAVPGKGPGTAFSEDASPELREALRLYDFAGGSLEYVLENAAPGDGATLWQILSRAPAAKRGLVYDRLTELVSPPEGVTRDGVLAGDPAMVFAWDDHVGLSTTSWWGALKKKMEMKGRQRIGE